MPDIQLVGIRQPVPGVPGVLYETNASFVNFIREARARGQSGPTSIPGS